MTRTKAEAIANPRAGDRWEGCGKEFRTVSVNGDNVIEFTLGRRGKKINQNWTHIFRRWAAGAEFIGGSDE